MATIERLRRKKGDAYLIRFYLDGRRLKICLPVGLSRASVEELANTIAAITAARKYGEDIPRRAANYLKTAPPIVLDKMAAVGLIALEKPQTIAESIASYIAEISPTLKPRTLTIKKRALSLFEDHFGAATPVASITAEMARTFVASLAETYSRASIEMTTTPIRTFYSSLIERGVATVNPFSRLSFNPGSRVNRAFDVPLEWTSAILDACPSACDRALFTLYRFGALRGAEAVALKWSNVIWDRRRLIVPSEKTARFGRESRVVPLFPEIEKALSEYFETLVEGAVDRMFPFAYSVAFSRVRSAIERAGIKPWSKLLQNMRATRENELIAAGYPAHVVAAWLGHTSATQSKYYLRVLDEFFERATAVENGAKNGAIEKNSIEK